MTKLYAVCLGCSFLFANFFLQVVPPVVRPPIISDTVWSALIAAAAVVTVAWLNRRDNRRTEERMKESVKTEVGEVKKEVTILKENSDGKLTELLDVNKELSEKIGIEKGKEIGKAEHEAQSTKDEASNIAKGKVEGLAEAKAERATASTLPTTTDEGVTKVEIVQPEGKPAPVIIKDATKKPPE